jgi:magnesium transporter
MQLEDEEQIMAFRILCKNTAAGVFAYLEPEDQQHIIEVLTDKEVQSVVNKLFLDDTINLIEELPADIVKKIIKNTSPEKRALINQFLRYDEDSAGSLMTIELVDLKNTMTIKEAIEYTRKVGVNKETINTCFVTDEERQLIGILPVKSLILNNEDEFISNILDTKFISVTTCEDKSIVSKLFKEYDLTCMAVVDKENRLVGIITIDDVVDVIEEQNTAKIYAMAGIEPNNENYLKTSVLKLAKHRIMWLLVLMLTATITGAIIQSFEDVLTSVVILASFIPVLMDTGGNAGCQSSTIIIRSLALGDITTKDILKILFKELRVSLLVGSALAIVNFARMIIIGHSILLAVTVSVSLFATVIIGKVVGGMLPLLAKKLKVDPAIMAAPLITTVVDATALIIYFTLARALLGI